MKDCSPENRLLVLLLTGRCGGATVLFAAETATIRGGTPGQRLHLLVVQHKPQRPRLGESVAGPFEPWRREWVSTISWLQCGGDALVLSSHFQEYLAVGTGLS
jgi:hypothetical protein